VWLIPETNEGQKGRYIGTAVKGGAVAGKKEKQDYWDGKKGFHGPSPSQQHHPLGFLLIT
jgi:hypothetical protein